MQNFISCVSAVFFIFLLKTHSVDGCSCFPTHPQTQFCQSDFVIIGKVISEKLIPGPPSDTANNLATWVYRIELIVSLKGIRSRPGSQIEIQTPGNSALCGVRLPVGKTSLLAGHKEARRQGGRGKVNIVRSCNLFMDEGRLTFEQMLYFFTRGANSYRRNCGCEIKHDAQDSSNAGCSLPSDSDNTYCYFSHGICRKTGNSCSWKNVDECSPKLPK